MMYALSAEDYRALHPVSGDVRPPVQDEDLVMIPEQDLTDYRNHENWKE